MRRKLFAAFVLVVVAAAAAGWFFAEGLVRGRIERAVAERLPAAIGPARSYQVRASGTVLEILRGHVTSLRISGEGVQLPNGAMVDRLDVLARDVRMDPRNRTISGVRRTDFTALVSQTQLNNYLTKTHPDMSRLDIALLDGSFTLYAKPRVVGLKVPVKLEGGIAIDNSTRLNLDLRKFKAVGIRAPGFLRNTIERKLNPVLDASSWGFPTTFTSATITEGALTITGHLDLGSVVGPKSCSAAAVGASP